MTLSIHPALLFVLKSLIKIDQEGRMLRGLGVKQRLQVLLRKRVINACTVQKNMTLTHVLKVPAAKFERKESISVSTKDMFLLLRSLFR